MFLKINPKMYNFFMFDNWYCNKVTIPLIGIGVIPTVVSPLNAKKVDMEFLYYKAHTKVDK